MTVPQRPQFSFTANSAEKDRTGPRGTYGCACVNDSARLCTALRYGRDLDDREQHDDDCECLCHQWSDGDDDYH